MLVISLAKNCKNNFINSLIQLFGNAITNALIELYMLGTANSLRKELSFGKLIRNGGARTGEILVYDVKSLKRIKNNVVQQKQQVVYANKQPVVDWVT